jgi:hypothetical protein
MVGCLTDFPTSRDLILVLMPSLARGVLVVVTLCYVHVRGNYWLTTPQVKNLGIIIRPGSLCVCVLLIKKM